MKKWRIWCDICRKETDGILKITVTDNFRGSKQEMDLCEECFQELKKKLVELRGRL